MKLIRYIVQDYRENEIYTDVYRTFDEAQEAAAEAWYKLTPAEQKKSRVRVFETDGVFEGDTERYTVPHGAFDSDDPDRPLF